MRIQNYILTIISAALITLGCTQSFILEDNSTPAPKPTPTPELTSAPYAVGDYYNDGKKEGVVFEVWDDGNSGKIVSMTQSASKLQWSSDETEQKRFVGANSETYGAVNMAIIKAISGWESKYPAFKWCADLGEGWYLPAKEELGTIYSNKDVVNANLVYKLSSSWYWSSTDYNYHDSDGVFCAWYVSMYDGYTSLSPKVNYYYVRAVSAFGNAKPTPELTSAPYAVGDYYNDGKKEGVVFEVWDDGNSGKIVSMTQSASTLQWSSDETEQKRFVGANSETYGAVNMAVIKSISGWEDKYPAFKWCADLGEGWYLPAKQELLTICNNKDLINANLTQQLLESWYWSSTEENYQYGGIFCAWGVFMYDGSTVSNRKYYYGFVRAVSAFGNAKPTTPTEIPDNEIWYTSTNGKIVTPYATDVFGATILSNTYESGKGVITFDAPVTSIGESAFTKCANLASVTIPNSATLIRAGAFAYCSSLASVTIPDSVTMIGEQTFLLCSSLTSVTIPNSVIEIGKSAFSGCSSLVEFNGKFASADKLCLIVDGVLNSFAIGCGVKEYTIPDSITSIGIYAFYSCTSLTSVTIGNSVTSIGSYAFYACSSLTSVYCKPTTPPASRPYMFENNASGRKIYVPAASVEAYKSVSYWSDYASAIVADSTTPTPEFTSAPYAVGDYYNDGKKEGVVFEVSADGKHGKIVSMTQSASTLQWSSDATEQRRLVGADSQTDGAANMAIIKSISGWESKYPAFKWCADLGEGWYLPAKEELLTIYSNKAAIDANLIEQLSSYSHWSSTEYDYYDSDGVFCAWYVYMGNGGTLGSHKNRNYYVRAVSAF